MTRHRRTDPLCRRHASTTWSRLVLRVALDWTRGRSCKACQ